jgi:hypothetical protein
VEDVWLLEQKTAMISVVMVKWFMVAGFYVFLWAQGNRQIERQPPEKSLERSRER